MNSKERLMRAVKREKPDRLPATVHQWLPFHLKYFMGGMSEMEAYDATGLDASLTRGFLTPGQTDCWGAATPEWRVEVKDSTEPLDPSVFGYEYRKDRVTNVRRYFITTPEGELTMAFRGDEVSTWVTDHLVKRDEDIELIDRYMPVASFDRQAFEREYDMLGDRGILRTYIPSFQPGPWQDAIEMHGMENMIMAACEKPDWVHRFMEILTQRRLRFVEENLPGLKADLMEFGGGGASCTVISPDIFEEFVLPYDRRVISAAHAAGVPVVYHTCGGMMAILELIAVNGCDASETLTPVSMGGDISDPAEVKRRIGDKVGLVGGVDQQYVLNRGDEGEIKSHVEFLFETYGAGGGYVCSPSDHFFDVPREKMEVFAHAARECEY